MKASPAKNSLYLHQKISETLRTEIINGRIPEGERLPAMEAMAKEWGTSYFTIRRALAPLVREGLIESRGKLGTVVIGLKPTLTSVGIYYGADVWRIPEAAFYRSIHQELCQQIEGAGMTVKPFIEPRPEGQHGTPPDEVVRMVEERAIQGLIIPIADEAEMRWVAQLPIPKAYLGSTPVPWRVQLDATLALRTALTRLRKNGVLGVGLIANQPSNQEFYAPFYRNFVNLLAEFGMHTQNHWCAVPEELLRPHESERFGYEAFDKIWNTHPRQRPEGLISVSDMIGRGLSSALLEKRIAVPRRLKVVQYKNKNVGFFTPLHFDWIAWDEAEVASTLRRQLERQIRGEELREILITPCKE